MEEIAKEILTMVEKRGGDIRNLWGTICERVLVRNQLELEKAGYMNNGIITQEGREWLKS